MYVDDYWLHNNNCEATEIGNPVQTEPHMSIEELHPAIQICYSDLVEKLNKIKDFVDL